MLSFRSLPSCIFVEYSMDSLDQTLKLELFPPAHSSEIKGIELSDSLAECIRLAAAQVTQQQKPETDLKLENYVVLEKQQGFYLLQDLQTTIFYIWSTEAESPVLKSTSWSVAYRAWLNLRANRDQRNDGQDGANQTREREISTPRSTEDLHDWVNRHQDRPQFGQLIYCRDRSAKDLLQYAIQLSETIALRWTPGHSSGILTLETVSRRQHRLAKWIEPQPQAAIAAALHCSIELFHQRWDYSPYVFNSEHWARLVTTGHCGSFQLDELLMDEPQTALSNASETALSEILEFNLEAEALLTAAIATHPGFAKDTSEFFAP